MDAGLPDHVDDLLGDGAFGGPHPTRRCAEMLCVERDAFFQLSHGVLAVAESRGGNCGGGHGELRQTGVHQQRQDGVSVGCHRHLDLPGLLQLLVQGDDFLDQAQVFVQHGLLIRLGEVAPFGDQSGEWFLR